MKRVQLDFEHLFYVEKLENRTIKVRKESNIGKPTKSLTPALMSCQIALTNSSGYWYKVDKNRRNHVGQECRFTTPGRLPKKYWDTLWSAEYGVLSCLSQPADRRPF